jgi:hypothetical protein
MFSSAVLAALLAASTLAVSPARAAAIPGFTATNCYYPCGSGGLDTGAAIAQATAYLNQTGYSTGQYSNPTADFINYTAASGQAAVWVNAGHGGPGLITTGYNQQANNPTPVSLFASDYVAASSGRVCSYPSACITANATSAYSKVRLMVFMGCETGRYYGGTVETRRNILDEAYVHGADGTLGFYNNISFDTTYSTAWATRFFADMKAGQRLTAAASDAGSYIYNLNHGNAGGYDSWSYNGPATTIAPATWGK